MNTPKELDLIDAIVNQHLPSAQRCEAIYSGPLPGAIYSAGFDGGPHQCCYSITRDEEGRIVCTGRGSHDLQDWIDNIQCEPTKTPRGRVHSGFYEGVPDMGRAILQFASKDDNIVLEGHSLAGARAVLAAARLVVTGIDPANIEVVTFGMPRPGFQDFADYIGNCEKQGMRITAYRHMVSAFGPFTLPDMVTQVPIPTPDWHYKQPVLFTDLDEHGAGDKAFDVLYRHSMTEYRKALEQ